MTLDDAVKTSIEKSTQEHLGAVADELCSQITVRNQVWVPRMDALEDGESQEYVYGLRVELIGGETFGEIAQRLRTFAEEEGWTWRDAGPSLRLVRLAREGYIVAASIFVDDGYASITGGAGCLGSIEDVPERDRPTS